MIKLNKNIKMFKKYHIQLLQNANKFMFLKDEL